MATAAEVIMEFLTQKFTLPWPKNTVDNTCQNMIGLLNLKKAEKEDRRIVEITVYSRRIGFIYPFVESRIMRRLRKLQLISYPNYYQADNVIFKCDPEDPRLEITLIDVGKEGAPHNEDGYPVSTPKYKKKYDHNHFRTPKPKLTTVFGIDGEKPLEPHSNLNSVAHNNAQI